MAANTTTTPNYAQAIGIDSVAGAVIFAVLYAPLLLFFIRQAIVRPTYVFIIIGFFSAARIASFVMRAFLAASSTAAHNLTIVIAYEILYNVGFFGLLYSAYSLVLDRGRLSDAPLPGGIISAITRRPIFFRIVLLGAVTVGITGAIESALAKSSSGANLGNTLRTVAIFMFLFLCILVALQTIMLIRAVANYGTYKVANGAFGAQYGIQILAVISLLLLGREVFFAATVNNSAIQNNENYWYPLAALTEFLAVVMFAAPGLVPSREELPS